MPDYTIERTGTTEYYSVDGDDGSYVVVRRYDANSDSSDWEVYGGSATKVPVTKRDDLIEAVKDFIEQE